MKIPRAKFKTSNGIGLSFHVIYFVLDQALTFYFTIILIILLKRDPVSARYGHELKFMMNLGQFVVYKVKFMAGQQGQTFKQFTEVHAGS